MARIARVIYSQVGRDAIQPSCKFRARLISLARAIHPQENFLRQILGGRGVACHPVHETDYRPAVLLYQVLESRLISCFHAKHDIRIEEGALGGHEREGTRS